MEKGEQADELILEARAISQQTEELLRAQLLEKDKQIEILKGCLEGLSAEPPAEKAADSSLDSSLLDGNGGSRKDRAFMDDFLISVLEQKDALQDQVYDLSNKLAETKAKLGMMQFEQERAESQRRMQERSTNKRLSSEFEERRPSTPGDERLPLLQAELQAKAQEIEQLRRTVAALEAEVEKRDHKSSRRERLRRTSSTNKYRRIPQENLSFFLFF